MIALNVGGFYYFYAVDSFPEHVPLQSLSGIGIVSMICAAVYVSMMALYYGHVVANQSELQREVQNHRATAVQLREAKEEAENANRTKSEFLAKMSHELRTPLNAVIGYSEMLLEDGAFEAEEQQAGRDLRNINSAGHYLLSLINDVLDLSKIEAGKMDLYKEPFDIGALVDELFQVAQPLCAKNGNELIVQRAADLGEAVGDKAKIHQAALNLLSNAAKFTSNGQVTLSAAREARTSGNWIKLSVRDTGIGIARENLTKLFQNFSQAEIPSKYGGTGLGLALTQKLCRLMGGDVSVESERGHGSCFTIRLPPSLDEAAQRRNEIEAAEPTAVAGGGEVVLVVDDDPAMLELMERILGKEGFRAVLADDSRKALSLATAAKPACIVLDVLMPGMDGWELLRVLKTDPELSAIPVVIHTIVDDRRAGLALGAAEYLLKPVDRQLLVRTLDRLCRPRPDATAPPATAPAMAAHA
jgi:signal transduction histidine kinase/CheY-like chemotaxis protein